MRNIRYRESGGTEFAGRMRFWKRRCSDPSPQLVSLSPLVDPPPPVESPATSESNHQIESSSLDHRQEEQSTMITNGQASPSQHQHLSPKSYRKCK